MSVDSDYAKGQDYSLFLLYYSYLNLHKYDLVIKKFDHLEKSAKAHANYEALADATILKAKTLSKITHYKKGLKELEKASKITKQIASKNKQNIYNGLIFQAYGSFMQYEFKSRDSVFYYYSKAKDEFQKIVDEETDRFVMYTRDDLLYNNYAFLANEFMAKENQLDSVDYYLDAAQKLNPKYENNVATLLIHNNIGWRFLQQEKYEDALTHYNKSVEIAKKYNHKEGLIAAYDGLSVVYEEMKDYKNASKYGNLMKLNKAEFIESSQNVISTSVDKVLSENENNFEKTNDNLSRIIIIIATLTMLCLYAAFLFYKKFRIEKLTKNEIESLLKEKMEQLSDSSQENEVILNKVDIEEIITLAMNDEATFYVKFQEAFPSFKKNLTDIVPTLVTSELKFAAYLKLDFSAKEIARYTNSSVRAVEAKKYRLRKKLNIPSEIDTNVWFSRI